MPITPKAISELLHVDQNSAEIYTQLLLYGELSSNKLQKLTEKQQSTVNTAVESLLQKGFIRTSTKKGEKCYKVILPSQMNERIYQQQAVLDNLRTFLLSNTEIHNKQNLFQYQGNKGLRRLHLEFIEETKKLNEPILAFESGLGSAESVVMEHYNTARLNEHLVTCIIAGEDAVEYKKKYHNCYTQFKLIPSLHIYTNIHIVGNLIMEFTLEPAQGSLRKDTAEANTWKSIHNQLWSRFK
jgi:predicted transcriptional regulator